MAEAAYLDAEAGSFSDSGYLARVGARWRLIKILEVGGFVRYDDPGDLDGDGENEDDEVYELNAMVYVWRIVVGLGYETQSDVDTYFPSLPALASSPASAAWIAATISFSASPHPR